MSKKHAELQQVTIDGWDPYSQEIIPFINVWKNYAQRELGTVATLRHGTQVQLLEHKGKRVKVRHNDAVGFVTDWFIREFKGGTD